VLPLDPYLSRQPALAATPSALQQGTPVPHPDSLPMGYWLATSLLPHQAEPD